MKTDGFRNIIFDFGGVIINIDFNRTINAFKKLGASDFDKIYSKASQTGIFDKLDKGHIMPEEFIDELLKHLPPGTDKSKVIQAWNAILIDIPPHRIALLKEIRKNYFTFLLSNTNRIHYEVYNNWLKNDYQCPDFKGLFAGVYLSFQMGLRKPEPEIFETVFRTAKIKKEETLFIDDSEHIIEKASAFGIPSYLLKEGQDVCELFENGRLKKEIG